MSFSLQVLVFAMPLISTFAVYLIFGTVILLARGERGDLYYSFLIEGLPWLLFALITLLPYL
jgi:hypothetical protein